MTQVGFIGAGNIANAIIGGAVKSGYITPKNIYIYDADTEKANRMSTYGVRVAAGVTELVKNCQYVFLTVKPQIYQEVLQDIRADILPGTVFISVGAGISISFVKNALGYDAKVIRVMPNTPLLYGNGATALVNVPPVTGDEFAFIKGFFDSSGTTCVLDEALMDAVTGVTGSSPAFVFRFARELILSGIQAGMVPEDAKNMVYKTLLGSAIMLEQSGLTPEELIKMVASPNGTTVAGLTALDRAGFDDAIHSAVEAAIRRAGELRK